MSISDYLERVITLFKGGHATEHSYRPALYDLFQSIDPALTVINEPKQSEGGMPDFMVLSVQRQLVSTSRSQGRARRPIRRASSTRPGRLSIGPCMLLC